MVPVPCHRAKQQTCNFKDVLRQPVYAASNYVVMGFIVKQSSSIAVRFAILSFFVFVTNTISRIVLTVMAVQKKFGITYRSWIYSFFSGILYDSATLSYVDPHFTLVNIDPITLARQSHLENIRMDFSVLLLLMP